MEIITSHANTDFDGLASMVAAGRLYPGARLVLSGGVDPGVAAFLSLHKDLLDLYAAKDLPLDAVSHVILVDTPSTERAGEFAELAQRPGVKLTLYDHHPEERIDPAPAERHFAPFGATVTLLLGYLRERNLKITPFEATLFALGIYADTGSFTYEGTTPDDLEAGAYLRRCGADLDVVRGYLHHGLTPEQHRLLGELLRTAETQTLGGIPVTLAWAETDEYVGDAAALASKLLELENTEAVFLLVAMEQTLYVIGRSGTDRLNVADALKLWDGGGHVRAASARIKTDALSHLDSGASHAETEKEARKAFIAEVKRQLLERLKACIAEEPRAGQIMSRPARFISADASIEEASLAMQRYGQSGLAVLEDHQLAGMISRRDVDKARHHQLTHAPVKGFMSRPAITASPDDTLTTLERRMIEENVGRLPVVSDGKVIGIVTRRDLLQARHGPGYATPPRNLAGTLEAGVEPDALRLLHLIGEEGDRQGIPVYLVGGFVRDLLLGRPNADYDLVTEGDALRLTSLLAQRIGATVKTHERFGTASLRFEDVSHLDLATARTESYARPAALPDVERSSIEDDLRRRDFTLNAMAIRLGERHFGELLDPFGGTRDLRRHELRILHPLSFIEDPTRIMRAARFEARFGFHMDARTLQLARAAMEEGRLATLTPERFRRELLLGLGEPHPWPVVQRWEAMGVLAYLHPDLKENPTQFHEAERTVDWFEGLKQPEPLHRELLFLTAMLAPLPPEVAEAVCRDRLRLSDPRRERLKESLECGPALAERLAAHSGEISQVTKRLKAENLEVILFAAALNPELREVLEAFFTRHRWVKLEVTGNDLIAEGYRPGPAFGAALEAALDAKLNGQLHSREEERDFLLRYLSGG